MSDGTHEVISRVAPTRRGDARGVLHPRLAEAGVDLLRLDDDIAVGNSNCTRVGQINKPFFRSALRAIQPVARIAAVGGRAGIDRVR